jgi:hypothetical protein
VMVRRRAGRLDDVDIRAADVLVDLHEGLAVGEAGDVASPSGTADVRQISSARGRLALPEKIFSRKCWK